MRTLLLATLPLGLALSAVAEDAKPFTLRSGPKQIPLIELFTSEGCSSCPPAEKWLGELTDTPGLWRDFVPVAWHVDYWDGLGWPDRFASKANTQRQELYAAGWRTPSIYTPGFVLDGAEWRGWGRSLDLGKSAKADAGTFELKATGADQFTVTFTRPAGTEGDFTATLAWLGNGLVSEVRRGENVGRKLRHNFIVLGRRWERFIAAISRKEN